MFFDPNQRLHDKNNALPQGHYIKLDLIIFADLIRREDIKALKKGIKTLLKTKRTSRFFTGQPHESIDSLLEKIDKMDRDRLSWYECLDFGVFDFQGESLETKVDYYSIKVNNINSGYLGLSVTVWLSQQALKEYGDLLSQDYHYLRGHIKPALGSRSGKRGGRTRFSKIHYNDASLKADNVYEYITSIEWELFSQLSKFLPLVLHNNFIVPPRIETYHTDIDYTEGHDEFWKSIGALSRNGQFIDERQKLFFECELSDRFKDKEEGRMIFLYNDAKDQKYKWTTTETEVRMSLDEYEKALFSFLFLRLLCLRAAEKNVEYKGKIDRIKLKKNSLIKLLKLRFKYEKDLEFYHHYVRDNNWEKNEAKIAELFHESDKAINDVKPRWRYNTHSVFCSNAKKLSTAVNDTVSLIRAEFDSKREILEHLSDFKNTKKNLFLNAIMLLVAIATLLLILFPDKIPFVSQAIIRLYNSIANRLLQ